MGLKMEFVERAKKGEKVAPLCREYGISRTTGHKWIKRFEERGYEGLEEQSRRPRETPLATAEDIVVAILETREAHPRWGPLKLGKLLERRLGEQTPSKRTIARVLKRAGKVRKRQKRRPLSVVERAPQVCATAPNEVWTVDFKGWWSARNGQRCEPLTVRDAFSRYVLATVLCRATISDVRAVFEKLFRRYGLPEAIQCDNGEPFISVRSRAGLTRLSAWWVSLGIRLIRSRVGCPQDNGGHERMHRDISEDVQSNPAETQPAQQSSIEKWRQEFNHVRPHQSLGLKTPAEVYKPTERRQPREFSYPPGLQTRRVGTGGLISVHGARHFVGASLVGRTVGLEPVDATHMRLWFYEVDLGLLEVGPEAIDTIIERWLPTPNKEATNKSKESRKKLKERRQG